MDCYRFVNKIVKTLKIFGKICLSRYLLLTTLQKMTEISDQEELRQLITRYLKGKASREEVRFLMKYYEHFEDQQDGFQNLSSNERMQLKFQILQEIQHKIGATQKNRTRVSWISRVAAAIIVLVIVGGVIWFPNSGGSKMEQQTMQMQLIPYVIDTALTQQKHIYLPDGSYVVLEPGSQLRYQKEFNDMERFVDLQGEAYFDVQSDSLRPFIVEANGVTTRVLGTAFSITSRDKSNEFLISVTRGKVEISDQSHQLGVLHKDDQLILDRVTNEVTTHKLKEEETAVIEPEEFVMDDMTLSEAIKVVEKRWGCNFDIGNPALKNCRFTTYFTPTDDLVEVVAVISTVIGAEYSIKDNVVSLVGNGCDK